MNYNELNAKFAIPGTLKFMNEKGNLQVAVITNQHATAKVSLYGAHVLSFIPNGQKDLLWMSPKSMFEIGKPIRGGIPVCFPWFGPHISDNQKPAHGFARVLIWEVVETLQLSNGNTQLIMGLKSSEATKALWPFDFSAKLIVEVGKTLKVSLCSTNIGNDSFSLSDALHTYFSISNISDIEILGLKDTNYYAGFEKEANNKQAESTLKIVQEENRRYINHTEDCTIVDKTWNRNIKVSKENSKVTVVWNPFVETTKTIGDIPDEGYKDFVCVEAVNSYDDSRVVKSEETHCVSTIIGID